MGRNEEGLHSQRGQRHRRIKGGFIRGTRLCLLLAFAWTVVTLLGAGAEAVGGTCGNRVLDPFEQCDDGNLNNGDGCSSLCQTEGDDFPVMLYTVSAPPPTPGLEELPLLSKITQHGITWTLSKPQRVGRFVNGDYYVVGEATIVDIQPLSTPANGRHGSMLNIRPNIQRSGFDSRIQAGRYDSSLRVYPPITLTPGNKLVSSRSVAEGSSLPCVMRPFDASESPVASLCILTSVAAPQPLDAFRPSYAQGVTKTYLSRNLRRHLLPRFPPVQHIPPLSEFVGYLKRPWVDSVFSVLMCPPSTWQATAERTLI